jgi:hypothetical protein
MLITIHIAPTIWPKTLPFFDDMIQAVNRLVVFLEGLGCAILALGQHLCKLLCESLVFSEFVQNWLMKKILDILVIVKSCRSCRSLVGLLLISGISGINSFQNTQSSRMVQR